MKSFIKIILLIFIISTDVYAIEFKKIEIVGNKRISNNTIIDIIDFKTNKEYDLDDINNFQKKLFETNFFKNLKINTDNETLKISVLENPLIDFFYINGVINKERRELFYDNLILGSNKIFSNQSLNKDINFIKETYAESGYNNVEINPRISLQSNNTLNLVLDINRGQKLKINRIYFIVDQKYSKSLLLDVISSSEYGWWKLFSTSSNFIQKRLDYDIFLLKNFFLNEGYYDVQITSSNVDLISQNLVDLTFSINLGSKYNFVSSKIQDNQKLLSNEFRNNVNEILKNVIKGTFSRKKLQKANDKIYNLINSQKLEFTNFNLDTIKNGKNIDIVLNFYKTKDLYINNINVTGNTITEEEVIRRNLLFAEGDSFTEFKLNKSIDKLKSTRIFEDINTKKESKSENLIDLNINVKEQPTGSISAGVGVGTDSSNISTGLEEKNLFGKGINSKVNLSLGTEKVSGIANFSVPDFNNTGNTLGYDFYVRRTDYENAGYESTVAGNGVSIGYDIYDDIGLNLGIGFDRDKINTSTSASDLYKSREGTYMTYKANYGIYTDKRNRTFSPSSGYKIGIGQTLGIPGSDIPYISNYLSGTYYYPLTKDFILNAKGGINTINSINDKDIKLSDRKFLSSKYLRGFESQGIGPKDGKDHIGGNYSSYSSISSTLPNFTPEKWNTNTIIFLDAGNVWGVDYDSSKDSDKIRSSFGLSLDWISPLGPLSFTFAETISKAPGDLEESFNFQLGSSF
ncbi:MAG: outer membrane protein assembly factor BamA [Pelagibacteraceae bacterium]|nr:outer membrane protein assembly factor BamA [Pelagibacteraceae bacterium]MCI5079142.1 outer membrane protein assembly factor BamA [Pelagibacteraceae bacterium]